MATQKLYSLLPYSLYRKLDIKGGDSIAILKPALPNITGSFSYRGIEIGAAQLSGAFYTAGNRNDEYSNHDAAHSIPVVGFDASLSNPIYGATTTVQPPALQLIPQIRY